MRNMKKSLFKTAAAAFALLAVACVQEVSYEDTPTVKTPRQLTAAIEVPATRTTIANPVGGKAKVSWAANDVIAYVSDSSVSEATITVPEAGSSVVITAETGDNDTYLSAVYGAEIDEWSADSLKLLGVAPSDQTKYTFADAHVCVAHTDALQTADTITFYNLVGIVKFKLTRSDVHHVVFQSTKDPVSGQRAVISGDGAVSVKWDAQTGEPYSQYLGTHGTTITINTEGRTGDFYISMLPCDLPGIEISLFDSNNVRISKTSSDNPLAITRRKIVDLGNRPNGKTINDTAENLSAQETANCYIVPSTGYYRFNATVKGNSNTSVGTPTDAFVMWQSYSASSSDFNTNGAVSEVHLEDGFVYLMANGPGSAGIAVTDCTQNHTHSVDNCHILWSWHIWVWPGYELGTNSQVYYNKTSNGKKYVMMDRNLGADGFCPAEGDKQDITSWGMVYQWGRKDPFLGRQKSFKGTAQSAVKVTAATGKVDYAVEHPRIYLYSEETAKDWVYAARDNSLWGTQKTQYDPCPVGWRVPDHDIWQNAKGSGSTFTKPAEENRIGFNLSGHFGAASMIFYPCAGYLEGTSKMTYSYNSQVTHWWSSGTSGIYIYVLSTKYMTNQVLPHTQTFRHYGLPVRCQLDGDLPEVPVQSVTVSPSNLDIALTKSATVTATVLPSSAPQTVTWVSSNEEVATVTSTGTKEATVVGVGAGSCTITATAGGKTATVNVTVSGTDEINLSAKDGPANCYIISAPGKYCFRVDVQGNDESSPVGEIDDFHVLWQTDGTSSYKNSSKRIISDDYFNDANFSEYYTAPFFHFETPNPLVNGNIVIEARKGTTTLWSWHIWVCDGFDPEASAQTYYKSAGVVMDRNLGALSATRGDLLALGLLYQWGRKDPFITFYGLTTDAPKVTTYPSPWTTTTCTSTTGTVEYSIKNPAKYIQQNTNFAWLYSPDNTLWASSKTKYDPCPPGWRVPDGGTAGLWAKSSGQTSTITQAHDSKNKGQLFTNIFADGDVWYPFAGYYEGSNGELKGQAQYGYYWSCTPKSTGYSYNFFISSGTSNKSYTATQYRQAGALSVRCVKE